MPIAPSRRPIRPRRPGRRSGPAATGLARALAIAVLAAVTIAPMASATHASIAPPDQAAPDAAPNAETSDADDDARRRAGADEVAALGARLAPRRGEAPADDAELGDRLARLDAGRHVLPLLRLAHRHPERIGARLPAHFDGLPDHAPAALCLLAIAGPDGVRLDAARRLEARRGPGVFEGVADDEAEALLAEFLRSPVDEIAVRAARLANRLDAVVLLPDLVDALHLETPGRRVRSRPLFGFTRAATGEGATALGEPGLAPDVFGLPEGARLGTWRRSWWYTRGDQSFRDEVHRQLLALARRLAGDRVRDPGTLGWDEDAWYRWYADELLPELDRRERARIRAARAAAGGQPGG